MRIVCVGDSITHGEGVEPGQRWTDYLQAELPEYSVWNRGVCGDTTRLALERFPRDVQPLEAEVVVIQFGLNDANRWETDRGLHRVSADAFRANLLEMVCRASAFGAHTVIIPTLTPPAASEIPRRRRLAVDAKRYNAAVQSACLWSKATPVDVWNVFQKNPDPDRYVDDIHLSPSGNREFASLILPAIREASKMAVAA